MLQANKTPVGRQKEIAAMHKLLDSKEPELLAVYGRRRVGKTFLIDEVYKAHIRFKMTGIWQGTLQEHLTQFAYKLREYAQSPDPPRTPHSWQEAFHQLGTYLDSQATAAKPVIFLDELPWMASRRSGFIRAFSSFWNDWAFRRNVLIVICGSATNWMLSKILHHRGGLHGRVTTSIFLQPFTLAETEQYLLARGVTLNRQQILSLYMAMGGIPYYLRDVQSGQSAMQNIERMCFSRTGLLYSEFDKLYASLFDYPENYIRVVRALGSKWKGLTRPQIVQHTGLSDGGHLSRILRELESCGFIQSQLPFAKKKKDTLFRLTDLYSLFYLRFIENAGDPVPGSWMQQSQGQAYKTWSGYAFENICILHVAGIKHALGISGVYSTISGFVFKGNDDREGIQIDLLIDRKDQVINICEIKYYNTEFVVNKSYAQNLQNKVGIFQEITGTKKQVFLTLITSSGLKENMHSTGLVQNSIQLDALYTTEAFN